MQLYPAYMHYWSQLPRVLYSRLGLKRRGDALGTRARARATSRDTNSVILDDFLNHILYISPPRFAIFEFLENLKMFEKAFVCFWPL